jgi:multiple sugar transport system permease protein
MATADVDVAARPGEAAPRAVAGHPRRRLRPARVVLNVFLTATALAWLAPLLWAVYTSLRPYEDTARRGYVSLPGELNLDNFVNAWNQAELPRYYLNTLIVVVPAVLLTLLLASFVAFVVSRFDIKVNLALLMLFTAGNLLPPQVIITPLYRMYLEVPLPYWMNDLGTLYDSYWGIIAIHVAFQLGFCIFVLSSYMKTIPYDLTEAALVDGAGVWRQYWRIILPLCRPALAALATLLFTWIYNDFFWALVLMRTGEKRPIVSALSNLKGLFFVDNNLIAAGALLAALPTLIIYFALQRHFVRGLTLGATKG